MEIGITRRNRDVVSDTRYKPFGCGESCNANISMPYFLCIKTPKTSKHYCYLACVHIKRIRGMFASSHNNGRLLVKLIFIIPPLLCVHCSHRSIQGCIDILFYVLTLMNFQIGIVFL